MNEEHIIAALLTAGLLAQNKVGALELVDAVSMYVKCLSELLESARSQPTPEGQD